MALKDLNTNKLKMTKFLKSLLCLIFLFCITFAGSDAVAAEQPHSETAVNLPVLDKPGMAGDPNPNL